MQLGGWLPTYAQAPFTPFKFPCSGSISWLDMCIDLQWALLMFYFGQTAAIIVLVAKLIVLCRKVRPHVQLTESMHSIHESRHSIWSLLWSFTLEFTLENDVNVHSSQLHRH